MIDIRIVNALDIKEIFEWRNDMLAVEMSLDTNLINWADHIEWFQKILNNEKNFFLMCMYKESKKKIGYVRFDIISNQANISINLSPSMRGKGLAKECLISSLLIFNKKFNEIKTINAKVKSKNIASIKTFNKAGFSIIQKTKEVLIYQYIFKNVEN